MHGAPPSQFLRRVNAPFAVGVVVQLGMNDWDALESKTGRVSCVDALEERIYFETTEGNAADLALTYQILAAEVTNISFQTREGKEILTGLDGEFLTLQHILARMSFADVFCTASGDTDGYHKVPLWIGTYPFDLDEYPIPVADMGALQETRGGTAPANNAWDAITKQIIARGRFLREVPKRRREWIMVKAATEAHLPRGRYHAIHIVNAKSDSGNLYDGGLTVTGPDIAINGEDGRDLQRCFIEDYADHLYTGEALSDPIVLPDDACAAAFGIEDIIQPIYWGGEDSISWESGVNGPITIRKDDSNDPDMTIYALRCVT